jgi:hypothetical protein
VLADNRLAELSGWDPALLRIELGALVEIDLKGELSFDIGVIGFETPEIDIILDEGSEPGAMATADATLEAAESGPAVTQLGDLWILGRHKILCADALEPNSYTRLMGEGLGGAAFQFGATCPRFRASLEMIQPDPETRHYLQKLFGYPLAAEPRDLNTDAKVENRSDGFHCLSIWDGPHRELKAYTRERMRAPDSFEHIEARITLIFPADTHRVTMDIRAQNGLGGMTIGTAVATIDNATCVASGIIIE